jgi:hypothetical protein
MTDFEATGIAEGFIEADSEEQVIEAWQQLIDSGLAFRLQGWFGRQALDLIAAGVCTAPAGASRSHLRRQVRGREALDSRNRNGHD